MYLGKAHHDASGPTFCWHCNRDLMPKPGGGVYFTLVVDRAQAEHRVHKACVRDVTAEGWTKLKGGQDGRTRTQEPSYPAAHRVGEHD